ncbi:MAG TPA: DUF1427 family protein [Symbiobacteriaceae bacterium]|nr:DUF1427 family protein [Symbiobacteriaceae bacterium]
MRPARSFGTRWPSWAWAPPTGCKAGIRINFSWVSEINWGAAGISILTGLPVGFLFAKLGFDPPAPPTLAGVTAILGVMVGWQLGR